MPLCVEMTPSVEVMGQGAGSLLSDSSGKITSFVLFLQLICTLNKRADVERFGDYPRP